MATPIYYKKGTAYVSGELEDNATAYTNIYVTVYNRQNDILVQAAMATAAGYDTSIFYATGKAYEVLIKDTVTASAQSGMYISETWLIGTHAGLATAVISITQDKLAFELRDTV